MTNNAWRGRLILTTLSPTHVGTGEVLRPQWEYDRRGQEIVRLDIEGFLKDDNIPRQQKEQFFTASPKDSFFNTLRDKIGVRYQMHPSSGRWLGKEIREAIKLTDERPYLPATSIKGALRTALMWTLFGNLSNDEKNLIFKKAGENRDPKFKAQQLENLLFRENTNDAKRDALKSLIIGDSPSFNPLEHRLYDISTKRERRMERDRRGPFGLEAIPPKTTIAVPIKVDPYFLTSERDFKLDGLGAEALRTDPETFQRMIQNFGTWIATIERNFYRETGMSSLFAFFDDLINRQIPLLPIGFGTGWNAKTIGSFLGVKDPSAKEYLSDQELKRAGVKFYKGHPPPKSRRIALDRNEKPALPLGWVSFKLDLDS